MGEVVEVDAEEVAAANSEGINALSFYQPDKHEQVEQGRRIERIPERQEGSCSKRGYTLEESRPRGQRRLADSKSRNRAQTKFCNKIGLSLKGSWRSRSVSSCAVG